MIHRRLLRFGASNVTDSSVAFPNIGSALGRRIAQVHHGIIRCAVANQTIAIGSQSGMNAGSAPGNRIVRDVIVVCSSNPKSHHSTMPDRVVSDDGMIAR